MEKLTTTHIESRMENVVAELKLCVDKDDAVRVSSLKEQLSYLKWLAAIVTKKYAAGKESVGGGGGLTINMIGMNGAQLRFPQVHNG